MYVLGNREEEKTNHQTELICIIGGREIWFKKDGREQRTGVRYRQVR